MVKAGVPSDRIELIYSGLPAPQVKQPRNWRRERGWPASTVVCGMVGAMTQEKGIDLQLRVPEEEVVVRTRAGRSHRGRLTLVSEALVVIDTASARVADVARVALVADVVASSSARGPPSSDAGRAGAVTSGRAVGA